MLFTDGTRLYGFDFYDKATEVGVDRSYGKKFDTGTTVSQVCPSREVTAAARSLAVAYDTRVLSPKAAETFSVVEKAFPKA